MKLSDIADHAYLLHTREKVSASDAVLEATSAYQLNNEQRHRISTMLNRRLLTEKKSMSRVNGEIPDRFPVSTPERLQGVDDPRIKANIEELGRFASEFDGAKTRQPGQTPVESGEANRNTGPSTIQEVEKMLDLVELPGDDVDEVNRVEARIRKRHGLESEKKSASTEEDVPWEQTLSVLSTNLQEALRKCSSQAFSVSTRSSAALRQFPECVRELENEGFTLGEGLAVFGEVLKQSSDVLAAEEQQRLFNDVFVATTAKLGVDLNDLARDSFDSGGHAKTSAHDRAWLRLDVRPEVRMKLSDLRADADIVKVSKELVDSYVQLRDLSKAEEILRTQLQQTLTTQGALG